MGRVANKIAIVTGGAGKGIGGHTSMLLAREGATVVVVDTDTEMGEETVKLIRQRGGQSIFIPADVTLSKDVYRMVEQVIAKYTRVDFLINSAGGAWGLGLLDIDESDIERNIALNLKSGIFCTRAVLPQMIRQKDGSVVFISSINAMLGGFSEAAYASAKAGLHSLIQTLTADYSKFGLRFNVVCAGSVPNESKTWKDREEAKRGTLDRLSKIYPLRRFGHPNDVAFAILFLASDEASWITGVVLPVDGGITATGHLPGGKWWEAIE